jgi:predicted secreted hydrolase
MRKKASTPKIRFPQDEGAHPAFPAEWWYGHFSLTDSEGREYGAMVAYFTIGLKILSISDLGTGQFHHFVSGSALHYVERKLDLRWGRDHWFNTDQHPLSYRLESYGAGLGLNLALVSEKPPLLGSGGGISEWTGGDSYYYSFTRLKAKGLIDLAGKKLDQQEILMFESLSIPTFHFWEGRTTVSGYLDGKAVSGVGYAELVRLPGTSG